MKCAALEQLVYLYWSELIEVLFLWQDDCNPPVQSPATSAASHDQVINPWTSKDTPIGVYDLKFAALKQSKWKFHYL